MEKVAAKERIAYSCACVLVYLMMKELPVYGDGWLSSHGYSSHHLVEGANSGTLMQLGVTPILTAGMTLHFISYTQNHKYVSYLTPLML